MVFNFDINFNDDINFLIGVNGSGKTTVLTLIYALLNPSITDLIKIDFSNVIIEIEKENNQIEISAKKDAKRLLIKYTKDNNKPLELTIPSNEFYTFQF